LGAELAVFAAAGDGDFDRLALFALAARRGMRAVVWPWLPACPARTTRVSMLCNVMTANTTLNRRLLHGASWNNYLHAPENNSSRTTTL